MILQALDINIPDYLEISYLPLTFSSIDEIIELSFRFCRLESFPETIGFILFSFIYFIYFKVTFFSFLQLNF